MKRIVCDLFNGASNGRMTGEQELVGIWKEIILA